MLAAAIFDLDGLLIDSEPLWRRAEIELFSAVGVALSDADCAETTGLRIDEVVAWRHRRSPWTGLPPAALAERIVDRVCELIAAEGAGKPGAAAAVARCAGAGLRLAVASSSPERLIHVALFRLGLASAFGHVVSAEHERYGKPHPAVLLSTAARLGVPPEGCLVLEDSLNGVIAAKAARMRCIAVPEVDDPRFALADVRLSSLLALDAATLAAVGA